MTTALEASDRIAHEPGNTRGWPKSKKQLRYALLRIRDGVTPWAASSEVYGKQFTKDRNYYAVERWLQPFMAFLQEQKNRIILRNFDVTTDRMLREVAAIALADAVSYVREVTVNEVQHFVGKPPSELDAMQRLAVKSWTAVRVETDDGPVMDYRYELHDKQRAQNFVGKHLGMLSETLLVQMASRRQAAEVQDYSHLSSEELDDAIGQLRTLQRRLRPAIDSTAEEVEEGTLTE